MGDWYTWVPSAIQFGKQTMRKHFDVALFAENDARARAAVTEYLTRTYDVTVTPNPDQYGVDLLVAGGLEDYAVECEVKRVWSGPVFPWDTVQLPERKARYAWHDTPVQYWVLNSECTHAIVIPGLQVRLHAPVEVSNKYVRQGEKFYQIPVSECKLVEIVNE